MAITKPSTATKMVKFCGFHVCVVKFINRGYFMYCKSFYKNLSKTALLNKKSIFNFIRQLCVATPKLTVMSDEERPKTSRKTSERESIVPGNSRDSGAQDVRAEQGIVSFSIDALHTNLTTLISRLSIAASAPTIRAPRPTVISDLTFNGLLNHWKKHGFKKIITMVGAGISTSAGIPDFRSPGTGLYNNLKKYNLPAPTDIFELDYFMENPKPFLTLAKELYPGSFHPTPVHYFIRLLHDKNFLVRHYTQNIDSLERMAGIPEEKLVEAHGTLFTNHCMECRRLYSKEWMKEKIFKDEIPVCDDCGSLVKPDIIFFGENLPERFYELPDKDFKDCDLLMIMGTSLEVHPFASLIDFAEPGCIRVLINRMAIDKLDGGTSNIRDISFISDCDDAIWQIAEALGWKDELEALIDREAGVDNRKKSTVRTNDNKPDDDDKRKSSKSLYCSNEVKEKV